MTDRVLAALPADSVLRPLLEQADAGTPVQIVELANEALWAVRSNPPTVLLIATELPDINGIEVVEILPAFDIPIQVVVWNEKNLPDLEARIGEAPHVFRILPADVSAKTLAEVLREAVAFAHSRTRIFQKPTVADLLAQPIPETSAAPQEKAVPPPVQAKPATQAPEKAGVAAPKKAESGAEASTPAWFDAPVAPVEPEPEHSRSTLRRLGDRSQTKPPVEPNNPPKPEEPASNTLSRRPLNLRPRATSVLEPEERGDPPPRRRMIVPSPQSIPRLNTILDRLSQELGAQCTLLADHAGAILVQTGDPGTIPLARVMPLISTSFSTAGEVARQSQERDATTLYIQEGTNFDLYCFDVLQSFLLVLVFNKRVASSKLGVVWMMAKRALRELQDALRKA